MIEAVMCDFSVSREDLADRFPGEMALADSLLSGAAITFGDTVRLTEKGLRITDEARPLARIIARYFDAYDMSEQAHASAI